MSISSIDFNCLNAITDDYENLNQIIKDINDSVSENYSEEEVCKCLLGLSDAGLLTIYEYDTDSMQYVKKDLSDGNWPKKWFLITEKGRKELDKYSNDL